MFLRAGHGLQPTGDLTNDDACASRLSKSAGSGPHSARCLIAIVCLECFVSVTRVYVVGWEEHVPGIGVEVRGHLAGVGYSSYHVIIGD